MTIGDYVAVPSSLLSPKRPVLLRSAGVIDFHVSCSSEEVDGHKKLRVVKNVSALRNKTPIYLYSKHTDKRHIKGPTF